MAPINCAWTIESHGQWFCVLNHMLRLVLSSNRHYINRGQRLSYLEMRVHYHVHSTDEEH